MDDHRRENLRHFFREAGADQDGFLPDDGLHKLSTGESLPFLFVNPNTTEAHDLPGRPPFRRGIFASMYRGRTWTMRQYAGFGTSDDTNRRFRYLLERGQTGLSMAFDLPTQMGLDPDDPRAVGEVGRAGVSVSSVDDMERIFDGIPLDRVSISVTANATAAILVGMLQVVAEERGLDPARLEGTVQNDVLKEYVARGTFIYPPMPSLALAADLIAHLHHTMPRFHSISISGYHIREAGADAVQEVGFTLANGLTYVRAAQARGLDLDAFAPRLSFFFACHNNFFEEVAKFRAARVAWATLVRDRLGATSERAQALRFHCQTGGSTLTAQQPENNVARVTLQALAAVLGGTQSLHTNAMDEALSLPSEATAHLALRTQQVIAEESHVRDVVDPLGGSYLVESLTDRICKEALALVDRIEGLGGVVRCIEDGWIQRQIDESAYRTQRAIDSGFHRVVGLNCHREDKVESERGALMQRRPGSQRNPQAQAAMEAERRLEVDRCRAQRDDNAVGEALETVRETAMAGGEVVPAIVEAVRSRATLGEIAHALELSFGRARPAGAR
jgi:methylmalonyl-CoA mutase N-terminal domain/subunit